MRLIPSLSCTFLAAIALTAACGSPGRDDTEPDATTLVCTPNTGICQGSVASRCKADGSGYEARDCDPVQGMACDAEAGDCTGVCSPNALGDSYIGCEYFPTIVGNQVNTPSQPNTPPTEFAFAITVSNPGTITARVQIDGPAGFAPAPINVEPGQVRVVTLPWTDAKETTRGFFVDNAYRVRSNQPVAVYQFSPLDYVGPLGNSFTNDASLLLPSHKFGKTFVVASWTTGNFGRGSLLAVTAIKDGTTVTIQTTANTPGEAGAPTCVAGRPRDILLNAGDVLQIGTLGTAEIAGGDLTGSRITSNQPIQVIGGHFCATVPEGRPACDHLEELMPPIETLATKYVVTSPAEPAHVDGTEQWIRVIATADDTTLTFDPPIPGAATTIANAGEFVEIAGHAGDFVVSSDKKILVAQYMQGQGDDFFEVGDPSLTIAVAVDQYRKTYLFHAPTNYDVNYVNITAPVGTEVILDGIALVVQNPIGDSGLGVVRAEIPDGVGGNHTLTSDEPIGISVYGYGQFTSYWYPGGLDLKTIVD